MYMCGLQGHKIAYPSPSSLIFVSLQTGSTRPTLILQGKQKQVIKQSHTKMYTMLKHHISPCGSNCILMGLLTQHGVMYWIF